MEPVGPIEPVAPQNNPQQSSGGTLPIVHPPDAPKPTNAHPLLGNAPIPSLRPFGQNATSAVTPLASDVNQPSFAVQSHPTDIQPAQFSPLVQSPEVSQPLPAQPNGIQNATPAFQPQVISSDFGSQPATNPDPAMSYAVPTPSGPVFGDFTPNTPGSNIPGGYSLSTPNRSPWKKWALLAGVPLLVVLLGSGYVFGIYIPNKPANVYKSGISRTGMVANKLALAGTQKTQLDTIKKGMNFSGSVVVDDPDGKRHSGTFSTKSDDKQSDSQLTYSPDETKNDFSANVLTDLASGAQYPSIYFRLSGMAALAGEAMPPELQQFDNKWISITPEYLQSLIPSEDTQNSKNKLTADDVAELTKTFIATTDEYVFTNDQTKNVLVNKGFVVKEKIEGHSADKYTVGIDKQHAKDYCKVLITNIMGTTAYKHIPYITTDNLESDKTAAIKECQQGIDDGIKASDTFDMWVDTKTKLIAKVRFDDKTNKGDYIEIGQSYMGGKTLPLYYYANYPGEHYNARISLSVDMDSNTTKGSVNVNAGDNGKIWKVVVSLTVKPNDGDVQITKPASSIPMQQVLQTLGLDPTGGLGGAEQPSSGGTVSGGIQSKAQDTERTTDLRALQAQLEGVYAQFGYYPTLTDLNSVSWRQANMKGLDSAALADPVGNKPLLLEAASATQYGYAPSQCDAHGSNCQAYTLTAVLNNGPPLTLRSLN
jgi:hypothetical protein